MRRRAILPGMLLVAHRLPRTHPGCAAFVAAGATMFECDVQFRGSDVVVSHFLPFLGRRGWVEHDNGRFRWRKGVLHRDLTLLAALDMIPAECGVLLDPKETDPGRRARLIAALAEILPDRSRFRVSTDRPDDLAGFHAAGFDTWRTIKARKQLEVATSGQPLAQAGVSLRQNLVDDASVAALRRVTATIVTWTVNDVDRAREVVKAGVDGITTENMDVMRATTLA